MMTDEVCPVGALTTKDFRFKARVWFLRRVETVCPGCATGCNAWLEFDPRSGEVPRLRPRDNDKVNKHWLCDDGVLTQSRLYNILQQVQPNKLRRIVLSYDETGRAISWVEVRIRRTNTEAVNEAQDSTSGYTVPFWYEPF